MRHSTMGQPGMNQPMASMILVFLTLLGVVILSITGSRAAAQTEGAQTDGAQTETTERDVLLQDGAQVYSQACSSCHQPGGVGLQGQFPPLLNNPNIEDAAYIRDVIDNGLEGPLIVLGESYDSVMPPLSTLDDADVEALIVYIQADFEAPTESQASFDAAETESTGIEIPLLAYFLAALVAALAIAPRLIRRHDRRSISWLDAGLKTAVIVVALVLVVVILPDFILGLSAVANLDRRLQDLIGLTVWGCGLLGGLWVLWYAQRESRI